MKFKLAFLERFMLTAQDVQAQNLREATIAHEEHQAAAEHHQALADMYAARVARIDSATPRHFAPAAHALKVAA